MLDVAAKLVHELASRQLRVVFAESCTGGLVAAELAKIPGVSSWLCGSAVTYRDATKTEWLGVTEETLAEHTAVSQRATEQMAHGVLARTPEASIAAAITGHLGPAAPAEFDGIVFTAIALRLAKATEVPSGVKHKLHARKREARQTEAATLLIQQLIDHFRR